MQKLQLSIPEPCHENWQQMTATEQGRFCNACAKEVIDFSRMTDMQVLNYFTNLTHEKVCGRALPEQLDRTISRPLQPKKRLFWYWNYIVIFFIFFGKSNQLIAQRKARTTTASTQLLTIAEIITIRTKNINAFPGKVGEVNSDSGIINGKVTDIDGNPVSFASIKIKGTSTGISADTNGAYSIRANPNDVLVISGASFKSTEEPVGTRSVINSALQGGLSGLLLVETELNYSPSDRIKAVAILKVTDEETGKFLPNVSVVINANSVSDTALTDRKGMHKIKGIKEYSKYFIKVLADGYEANEFTIDSRDFKDRKKEWEILLRKQKVEITKSKAALNSDLAITTRGGVFVKEGKGALYVVDGIIMPMGADINPEDVETYTVLQGPQAMAIFGSEGSDGAIVITTKKLKVKNLDTVVVSAYGKTTGRLVCTTTKSYTVRSRITDSLKMVATKITGSLKIYPNPVQRGNKFNISLKLKQTGLYQIQITDAAGRVVLQKQIHAVLKEFTEKLLTDNRWSNGVYYICIIDNKNQLVNKSSFILQ